MNILFLSRPLNRIGHALLEHLVLEGRYVPSTLWVHDSPSASEAPSFLNAERKHYADEVAHYGCEPIKFLDSVCELAMAKGIASRRIADIRDDRVMRDTKTISPDLILIGGGWPQRIPPEIIRYPKLGVLNIHPSLLPDFRGTDVHRWQILLGTKVSGVTVHQVEHEFDAGNVLAQDSIVLSGAETPQELVNKLAALTGPLVSRLLRDIQAAAPARLEGAAQAGRSDYPYCRRWPWGEDEFLRIQWDQPAGYLERLVRASTQESYKYNGPYFFWGESKFFLRVARVVSGPHADSPGQILECANGGVTVACGDATALQLARVQVADEGSLEHRHRQPALKPGQFIDMFQLTPGLRFA